MDALKIIQSKDYKEIVKIFRRNVDADAQAKVLKQYDVSKHDVFDTALRPWRKISRATTATDAQGNYKREDVYIDVVRVGISWQNDIVEKRVAFALSNPVKIDVVWDKETDKEKELVKMVGWILNDNKMDYKNKEVLRKKLSELEVAVIWYYVETGEPKPKYTLKCKIVSPSLGDTLYPLFDVNGKMIAFRRDYQLIDGDKKIDHSDIYTDEFEYKYVKKDSEWILDPDIVTLSETGEFVPANPVPNVAKKILVEYYSQKKAVWDNVQSMIDRHEMLTSNHGGMNDKFGAPLLVIAGEIQGEVTDNQTGSVLQMENQATADYAQLASEPESISLEQKNLEKFIGKMSQTPNITFDQMIEIGQMSGFAAEMLFTDPHMAVRMEEESFGIGLQRRLNIIKAAIGALIDTSLAKECKTVQLKPVITPYLPQNTTEIIENLGVSVGASIMSQETAVERNPLVVDPTIEMIRLKDEGTTGVSEKEVIKEDQNNG